MRRLIAGVVLIFACSLGVAAQASKPSAASKPSPAVQSTAAEPVTEATVNSFLKHMFGYDASISWDVLDIGPSRAAGVTEVIVLLKNPQGQQNVRLYVTQDGKHAVVGDLMPFGADPFAPARAEIAARANGPARGPANAAVTIVEFSDLECPSCKAAQATIDRLLAEEPDVRFIFQNFPLRAHPWAFLGAAYVDCIGRQNTPAVWKFIEAVYANQEQITAMLPQSATSIEDAMKQAFPAISKKLQELAASAGANPQKVSACAAEPATAERIRKSIELGEGLDVTGTPTLFVNGRRIQNVNGLPYEVLKSMVDAAKTAGK
ncbi:MAG TPA: thioredoxin domain-containing protein [Terriglobales bacterium]|nr:thioredoxin domain-containing protein [Terriglobales bacterium]